MIYNIQYEPDNNGIEFLWASMKNKFRKKLTHLKISKESFKVKEII